MGTEISKTGIETGNLPWKDFFGINRFYLCRFFFLSRLGTAVNDLLLYLPMVHLYVYHIWTLKYVLTIITPLCIYNNGWRIWLEMYCVRGRTINRSWKFLWPIESGFIWSHDTVHALLLLLRCIKRITRLRVVNL